MMTYQPISNVTLPLPPVRQGFKTFRTMVNQCKILGHEDIELLQTIGYTIHSQDGQMLFEQGEPQTTIHVLLQGKVKVGQRRHCPEWLDLGPFGLVDLANETSDDWADSRLYNQVACLSEFDLFSDRPHTQSAISVGACKLLIVNVTILKKFIQVYPAQGARLQESLRLMMI